MYKFIKHVNDNLHRVKVNEQVTDFVPSGRMLPPVQQQVTDFVPQGQNQVTGQVTDFVPQDRALAGQVQVSGQVIDFAPDETREAPDEAREEAAPTRPQAAPGWRPAHPLCRLRKAPGSRRVQLDPSHGNLHHV